jgi:hypothetical protein
VGGNNYWNSYYAEGLNPRILEAPVNQYGVTEVHTLINTLWGRPGPESYAYIEFIGSDGAYYRKDLVGNDDIRDVRPNIYTTNVINETTTINVWTDGYYRLDKQQYILPIAFHTQNLDTIRLVDNGADGWQRVFLAGVTVKTLLPELDIEKLTNGRQADNADDYDVPRIAAGETVSWTYTISNMSGVAFPEAEILVTDSQPGVTPVLDVSSDDGDLMLSPNETWIYTASAPALDLMLPPGDVAIVPGCNDGRNTYENTGRVDVAGTIFDEDNSHYCNAGDVDADGVTDSEDNCMLATNGPLIPDPGGNIQLDTDGDDFGNLCDPDFDNNLIINAADLAYMKTRFFTTDANADLTGNGIVNAADLAIIKIMFFGPPGPSGLVP